MHTMIEGETWVLHDVTNLTVPQLSEPGAVFSTTPPQAMVQKGARVIGTSTDIVSWRYC